MVEFESTEKLLRAVRKHPNFWKKDGRLSPVAFKTRIKKESGTSVYRQAGRSLDESIQAISKNLEGVVVSVTYKQCIDFSIKVTETDVKTHHCDLTNEDDSISTALTNVQCQNLADYAVVECEIQNVNNNE